jgi:glucokinase
MILGCDVGGTKTNLALFAEEGGVLRRVHLASYRSAEHASLDEILARFLSEMGGEPAVAAAGFGVAGPITGTTARVTNLPWVVDGARLARQLGLAAVALLNDVEAFAWALPRLGPADVVPLQAGTPAEGTAAVIAAGTGVGYSALLRGPTGPVSLPSEAGHGDFAPGNETEVALWRWLRARHGHVSVERVLSGVGLAAVHAFLLESRGATAPAWRDEAAARGEEPAAISAAALEGRDLLCAEAVDLFLDVYGAEAGSWALRTLATGGLFLGGGIAAKLLFPEVAREGWREHAAGRWLRAFRDKGRFRPLLESIPVGVIVDDKAAVLGAASRALQTAGRAVSP